MGLLRRLKKMMKVTPLRVKEKLSRKLPSKKEMTDLASATASTWVWEQIPKGWETHSKAQEVVETALGKVPSIDYYLKVMLNYLVHHPQIQISKAALRSLERNTQTTLLTVRGLLNNLIAARVDTGTPSKKKAAKAKKRPKKKAK